MKNQSTQIRARHERMVRSRCSGATNYVWVRTESLAPRLGPTRDVLSMRSEANMEPVR